MENRRILITKQLLCESFISLLKQKPIDKISVTELCQAANVNRGSFYAHYADVYDLLGQIESIVYERLCDAVRNCNYTKSDFPRINKIIETVEDEINEKTVALYIKTGKLTAEVLQKAMKQFLDKCCEINRQDITNEWRQKFPDLDDLTLNTTYTFMVKGSLGTIEEWVNNDFSQSADFISLSICDMYAAVLAKLDSMQKSVAAKK